MRHSPTGTAIAPVPPLAGAVLRRSNAPESLSWRLPFPATNRAASWILRPLYPFGAREHGAQGVPCDAHDHLVDGVSQMAVSGQCPSGRRYTRSADDPVPSNHNAGLSEAAPRAATRRGEKERVQITKDKGRYVGLMGGCWLGGLLAANEVCLPHSLVRLKRSCGCGHNSCKKKGPGKPI